MLLGGAGCAQPAKPLAPPASQVSPHLRVALTVAPSPARQMDPETFTVRASDADGRPVSGAVVTISLAMPGMDMGGNEVKMHPAGPGTYIGTGRFSMDGGWQAQITAIRDKDKTVQFFPIKVQ